MNDRREAIKQNREHSITPYTAALVRIAESLGWDVERYYDHSGVDTLEIARNDILCGPEDRDVGLFRCPYSVTIPVADQGKLSDIIYDNAYHPDINGYLNWTFPKRSIYDNDDPCDFEGMERDSELLRAAMKNFCDVLHQLKNDPAFLLAQSSEVREAILENAVKKFGIYCSAGNYCYDTKELGHFDVAYCGAGNLDTIDEAMNHIDCMLEEVEDSLDHFKDTFQECLERKIGFVDDFTGVLQDAHRLEVEWKKWADVCERENLIRVMRADEMPFGDETVPIGGKQDG